MIPRRVLCLALTFALIAGCGSEKGGGEGGGGENSLAALDAAAGKAKEIKSFRHEFTMRSDLADQKLSFDGEGTSSADSRHGRLTGTLDVGQGPIEFEGIVADEVMYLKGDAFGLPKGKWLKSPDPPTSTLSPGEFVGFLKDAEGVKRVGSETIRGEETEHFRGPLNIKELAEESGSEIVERLRQTPEVDKFDIVVDVWVMQDGLPARLTLEMTAPGQASGSMKVTSDILEYDVPLNDKPPPAGQVVEGRG